MPCTTKLIGQSTEEMCPPLLIPLQSLQKWPTDSCKQFPLLSPLFLPFTSTSPQIPQIPQFDPTIPPPPLPSKLKFPGPSPTSTTASNRQSTDIYSRERIFPYFPNIQSATKCPLAASESNSARPQFSAPSFSPFSNFTSQTSASMKMKMKASAIPQTFDPTIRPPPSLPNKPLVTTANIMDGGLFLISS